MKFGSWDFPAGSEEFRPEKTEFEFRALVDFTLPGDWDLNVTFGAARPYDSDAGARYSQGLATFVFSGPVASKTGLYVEAAVRSPDSKGGNSDIFVDGGLTYLIKPGLHLDVGLKRGLTDAATDWSFLAGIAFFVF